MSCLHAARTLNRGCYGFEGAASGIGMHFRKYTDPYLEFMFAEWTILSHSIELN